MYPFLQSTALVVFGLFTLVPTAVAATAPVMSLSGTTMGTTWQVKVADVVEDGDALQGKIQLRLDEINRLMSTYDPQSELSQFNASPSTDWYDVSQETATVVAAALEVAERSHGAFDPTVGKLVKLWNFGSGPRTEELPSDEDVEAALARVGYKQIDVRLTPPGLRKTHAEVELDLSAIAKGYAVDALDTLLSENGYEQTMVEIGGEVRVSGRKHGQNWKLGVERPALDERSLLATVELQDEALATSGDYRNYFVHASVRYSHTIDPRTGRPVTHQLASASVVDPSCMTADAWATAMMVLGPQEGLRLAEQQQMPVLLIERDGDRFRERASTLAAGKFQPVAQLAALEADPLSPFWVTFLISLTVFGIAIGGLAIGTIIANKSLKGSCGGIEGTTDEHGNSICELCTTPPEECDRFKEELQRQLQEADHSTR